MRQKQKQRRMEEGRSKVNAAHLREAIETFEVTNINNSMAQSNNLKDKLLH